MKLKIGSNGRIVIPATLRQKYSMTSGSSIEIVDHGGVLTLIPWHDDPIEAAAGMLEGGTSSTEALLAEHQQARKNESA